MIIRLATAADIPAIIALERQCDSAAHWTELQYEHLFREELFEEDMSENESPSKPSYRLALAVEENPRTGMQPGSVTTSLLGFLIAHNLGHEWELENIAVAPAARRKGLATRLLQELFRRAADTNGEAVFLEVRESNQLAQTLYRRLGFREFGRRKGYYQKPFEDAIQYRRTLL